MLKSLFRLLISPLYNANLFHVFAIAIILAETFTDSVFDSIIGIILYQTFGTVSETSVPYLFTYLLPAKPVWRFIIIGYIIVICLWRICWQRVLGSNCKPICVEQGEHPPTETTQVRQECIYTLNQFPRKITEELKNIWNRCNLECALLYPWIACRRLLVAALWCTGGLWKFCHLNCVSRPLIGCRNANYWLQKQPTDGLELRRKYGSCKDFRRRPEAPLLSSFRSRSLSWGELIHLSDGRYQAVLKTYSKRLTFYRLLPLKKASRLWGRINRLRLPVWLRSPAFRLYIWLFGCCLEDALVQDLTKYRNLCEFFQRYLRPGIRPIDNFAALVSPVDGTVLHFGMVKKGMLEQVKGITYSLKGFLGPMDELLSCVNVAATNMKPVMFSIEKFSDMKISVDDYLSTLDLDDLSYYQNLLTNPSNHLFQCIVYLAPGDYHRFHSPADWTVFGRRHFPGELFSVNPGFARWLQGLFNFNERATYIGRWRHGFFSMTAVGATNVGSINVHFDKSLSTNVQSAWDTGCFYDAFFVTQQQNGVNLRKGGDFGAFNLGSTVVLLFEAPSIFKFQVEVGQKLKYGQGIGDCSEDYGDSLQQEVQDD